VLVRRSFGHEVSRMPPIDVAFAIVAVIFGVLAIVARLIGGP
jgi:hypothetical protein